MKSKVREITLVLQERLRPREDEIKSAITLRAVHRDNISLRTIYPDDTFDFSSIGRANPENTLFKSSDCEHLLTSSMSREVGCDEAGRGCLAGPVFAAAVILPDGFYHPMLNDSKQMSEAQRNELRAIIESEAVAWSVIAVDAKEIDRINILNASITAMQRAIASLKDSRGEPVVPTMIYVDGNRFKPYRSIPYKTVVKGDGKMLCIAAASVLAKTHRDEYMRRLAAAYPQYGWDRNVGYPTKDHREAILKHGVTPYHRMTYKLLSDDPTIF